MPDGCFTSSPRMVASCRDWWPAGHHPPEPPRLLAVRAMGAAPEPRLPLPGEGGPGDNHWPVEARCEPLAITVIGGEQALSQHGTIGEGLLFRMPPVAPPSVAVVWLANTAIFARWPTSAVSGEPLAPEDLLQQTRTMIPQVRATLAATLPAQPAIARSPFTCGPSEWTISAVDWVRRLPASRTVFPGLREAAAEGAGWPAPVIGLDMPRAEGPATDVSPPIQAAIPAELQPRTTLWQSTPLPSRQLSETPARPHWPAVRQEFPPAHTISQRGHRPELVVPRQV